jgi:hypothetical protein
MSPETVSAFERLARTTGSFEKAIEIYQGLRRFSPTDPQRAQALAREAIAQAERHFTRLTNSFSKKVENHAAAVALYFMYYNFGRVHQTLRVTPAMEAGVANRVWSVEGIVGLLDRAW